MCLYHARPLPAKSFIGERLKDDLEIVQHLTEKKKSQLLRINNCLERKEIGGRTPSLGVVIIPTWV